MNKYLQDILDAYGDFITVDLRDIDTDRLNVLSSEAASAGDHEMVALIATILTERGVS